MKFFSRKNPAPKKPEVKPAKLKLMDLRKSIQKNSEPVPSEIVMALIDRFEETLPPSCFDCQYGLSYSSETNERRPFPPCTHEKSDQTFSIDNYDYARHKRCPLDRELL